MIKNPLHFSLSLPSLPPSLFPHRFHEHLLLEQCHFFLDLCLHVSLLLSVTFLQLIHSLLVLLMKLFDGLQTLRLLRMLHIVIIVIHVLNFCKYCRPP